MKEGTLFVHRRRRRQFTKFPDPTLFPVPTEFDVVRQQFLFVPGPPWLTEKRRSFPVPT